MKVCVLCERANLRLEELEGFSKDFKEQKI